jgi:hypothetical protein
MPECMTVLHGRCDGQILLMIYLEKPICPQKRVKKAALKDNSLQSPLQAPTLTPVTGSGRLHDVMITS